MARTSSDHVAISIVRHTKDFQTFVILSGRESEQLRCEIAPRLIELGIIDGGSVEDVLGILADDVSPLVRSSAAAATSDPELKRHLAEDPEHEVRRSVLSRTEDQELYGLLAADPHPYVRGTVAHGSSDIALLDAYLNDADEWVRNRAAQRLRLLTSER